MLMVEYSLQFLGRVSLLLSELPMLTSMMILITLQHQKMKLATLLSLQMSILLTKYLEMMLLVIGAVFVLYLKIEARKLRKYHVIM